MRLLVVVLGLSVVAVQNAAADLYVLQIGDGSSAAHITTGIAAPIVINKFADAGGAALASVAMPTTTTGANSLFTTRGNSTTESFMHLSTNGQYLLIGGVAAAPGTALPGTSGDVFTCCWANSGKRFYQYGRKHFDRF